MSKPLPPFSCSHSPNIPELLHQLNCTLAISTYQAGKVILISAPTPQKLVQLPRNFKKPMGIALSDNKMAIATEHEVVTMSNAPNLAKGYPKQPNTYDAFYLPRAAYYTGNVDLHDLEWGNDGLWSVNTRFSCLSLINDDYSFIPKWKPHFIDRITPEDRCHLNGMAMQNGLPKYVTALGQGNATQDWRNNKLNGGVIMDVGSNQIIVDQLPMPHSPRLYDGDLYVLLSATGELVRINRQKGSYEVIKAFSGFVRGMARIDDYLFIGLSKIRETTSAFGDMPIAKKSVFCGIVVMYIPQFSIVGQIKYETSVEEIYDVKVIPNTRRPGLLSHEKPEHRLALSTPQGDFWAVQEETNT
ncbi:MAG: TIGR03032 family protein [Bacteroidota bacterium]